MVMTAAGAGMSKAELRDRVAELEAEVARMREAEAGGAVGSDGPAGENVLSVPIMARATGKRTAGYIRMALTARQGRGLRAIYDAIEGRGVCVTTPRVKAPRVARSQVDAIRYMLEQVEALLPRATA